MKRNFPDLARFQKKLELGASLALNGAVDHSSRLVEVGNFGGNPGNLRMLRYAPPRLPKGRALVVALHGCTQTASAYDFGSGWSALADAFGFSVLFPEQQAANNPNRCFSWFLPSKTRRGQGEAHSIHQMIERMAVDHGVDRERIFVVGLSAGGAMAAAMLANYPDVFAGGAIIAGLPYGAASNVQTALQAMAGKLSRTDQEWGALVHAATLHKGTWPKLSIWHGTSDAIVSPANIEHIISQWCAVHDLDLKPDLEHILNGHTRRVWQVDGEDIIEAISILGMGHGVPLASMPADRRWGNASPFHLDVGVSSSRHILEFWTIADTESAGDVHAGEGRAVPVQGLDLNLAHEGDRSGAHHTAAASPVVEGANSVITAALRAAGIIKDGGTPSSRDPRGLIAATLRSVGLLKE